MLRILVAAGVGALTFVALFAPTGQTQYFTQPAAFMPQQASPQMVYYTDASGYPMQQQQVVYADQMQQVYFTDAGVPVQRVAGPVMSAVTERDADGNPVVHEEMFDPIYYAVIFVFFLVLLAKVGYGI
jgi:hypothetical protein